MIERNGRGNACDADGVSENDEKSARWPKKQVRKRFHGSVPEYLQRIVLSRNTTIVRRTKNP
jgi:hypothetical protein